MFSLIHIIDGAVLLTFLIAFSAIHSKRRPPYPPGPTCWPIIGNLLGISPTFPWLAFTKYSKKYGHITSYRFLEPDIVILSSTKTIKGLLEKRGDVYSDRPVM